MYDRLYRHYKSYFTLLTYHGPTEPFLLFKLTEDTGLVVAHIDIEEDNGHWYNINELHAMTKDRWENSIVNSCRDLIYKNYKILFEPIKEKIRF